jgi:hypothetical protein
MQDQPTRDQAAATALDYLQKYAYFVRLRSHASLRKERQEQLMQRRIARKWGAAKKSKMVRRLARANHELQQCAVTIDELERALAQLSELHGLQIKLPVIAR